MAILILGLRPALTAVLMRYALFHLADAAHSMSSRCPLMRT